MKEAKFPVSDQQMMVLLSKYPFLKHNKYWVKDKELVAREVYSEELENNEHNWYKIWDGHGWERLWKLYFMPRLFKLYNSWDDEKKSQFYFVDTKSKYGSLRLSTSFSLPDDMELILEWMSEFICETCGAEPKDEKGHHIIYETNGNCAPYRVTLFAATEENEEGEELMTVNVSRSGKVTIGDEEDSKRR